MTIEEVLKKYELEDAETLNEILSIHRFLSQNKYATLPKEDFDALFNELRKREDPWRPIGEYDRKTMDWVLVQFKDIRDGFMLIPMVAERHRDGKWYGQCDFPESWYLNKYFVAVAFMEIPPYEE